MPKLDLVKELDRMEIQLRSIIGRIETIRDEIRRAEQKAEKQAAQR